MASRLTPARPAAASASASALSLSPCAAAPASALSLSPSPSPSPCAFAALSSERLAALLLANVCVWLVVWLVYFVVVARWSLVGVISVAAEGPLPTVDLRGGARRVVAAAAGVVIVSDYV